MGQPLSPAEVARLRGIVGPEALKPELEVHDSDDPLLTPAEVAAMARCDPKTVTRWAMAGRLPVAVRLPGGHRRYRLSDVQVLLDPARWESK